LDKSFESSSIYADYGLSLADTLDWDFQNGFSKGDVIFVVGAKNVGVGDVIIFTPKESLAPYPIIHRVVKDDNSYGTKGDNYKTNHRQLDGNNPGKTDERNISGDEIIGKALFRIPFIGWAKLVFFESFKDKTERGFCSGIAGGN